MCIRDSDYIDSKVMDDGKPYYIVLDEVQLVEEFVEVILSLTHMRNVDVYVSGSNSRFLSSDVAVSYTHLDVYKRQGPYTPAR